MLLTTFLCLAPAQLPQPPMHRAWTALTGDSTKVHAVRGATVYYSSLREAGALNLVNGTPRWKRKIDFRAAGAVGANELYLLENDGKRARLMACRLTDGGVRKVADLETGTRDLAADGRRVYVLTGFTVQAIDPAKGKVLWKRSLGSGKSERGIVLASLTAAGGRVLAGVDGPGFHCLDATTGRVLWKEKAEYGVYNLPIPLKSGFITVYQGVRMHDYATGRPRWTYATDHFEPLATIGEVLVGNDGARLTGIDTRSGKRLWQGPKPKENWTRSRDDEPLAPTDGTAALIAEDEFMRVTKGGQITWRMAPFFAGRPFYADAGSMICQDGERILGYVPGPMAAPPAEEATRAVFARKRVAEIERLDDREREQLVALAPYATQPLLRKYVEWALANREDGPADREGRGQFLYGQLTETAPLLERMATPNDTEALVQAIQDVGRDNAYRGELVQILGRKGDPAKAMPLFVRELRANPPKPGSYSEDGATLDAVARSSDPAAVRFMIEALENPKAPPAWRHEAFVHLAGTGGEAGIEAVRKARAKRGPRPTWEDRMMAETLLTSDRQSERRDAKGRVWRLLQGPELGNSSDRFLQGKTERVWGKPIFTGIFTDRTWTEKAPETVRGVPMLKVIQGEWLRLFPDDPAIRVDADGDGLTDLVEARLGTDAKRPDTDEDGLRDDVDPCPNAAPRELGDREKIIAACVEARFFAQGWRAPAVIAIDGVKPFEMVGYGPPLLWQTPEYRGTLPKMYGTGVNTLGFHAPSMEARGKDWLEISPDGKRAATCIRRYSGGLNGDGMVATLVKVGEDWFVTDLRTMYVS